MGGAEHKRIQWDRQIEFLLACVGYCIGYGDVWRYPYLCYKNGGGAFLIPSGVSLLIAGIPLFYMELCLGQYSSLGPVSIFGKTVPIFQGVGWAMVICSFLVMIYYNMILAWVLLYLALSFRSNLLWSSCRSGWNSYRVKTTGKVVYFTATFPMVILVILFFRGITLDGASKGISVYMTIDLSRIFEVNVWKDAVIQTFYSLGPAFGGLLTMASYNKFKNNCFRDSAIICFINYGTSVFAGFSVFSILGFMATDLNLPVKDVVRDGIGLAFIAYPEAISRMPLSPLWAVLFFFMLVTLGLDSMFATCETVTTAIQDQFPKLRKRTPYVVFVTCVFSFICGLPICTRAGMYCFTLLNDYSAGYPVMLLAFLEVATTTWIYGLRRFVKDIQMMLGVHNGPVSRVIGPTGYYWQFMWFIVSPVLLMPLSALFRPSIEWCPSEEREQRKHEAQIREMQPYTIPQSDGRHGHLPNAVAPAMVYHNYGAGQPAVHYPGGWRGGPYYPGGYGYPYHEPEGYYYHVQPVLMRPARPHVRDGHK